MHGHRLYAAFVCVPYRHDMYCKAATFKSQLFYTLKYKRRQFFEINGMNCVICIYNLKKQKKNSLYFTTIWKIQIKNW